MSVLSECVVEQVVVEQRTRLSVCCQSGSKCTVQTTMSHLLYAAASQDQEASHLLFPQLLGLGLRSAFRWNSYSYFSVNLSCS